MNLGEMGSAFGALVALASAIASVAFYFGSQRKFADQVFYSTIQKFYSPEYYRDVVAPSYDTTIKWFHLPDGEKATFRRALIEGWAESTVTSPQILMRRFGKSSGIVVDVEEYLYREVRTLTGLTEVQALTSYLWFWSELAFLIRRGFISKRDASEMFLEEYRFTARFVREFREAVRGAMAPSDAEQNWMRDTAYLERQWSIGSRDHDWQRASQ